MRFTTLVLLGTASLLAGCDALNPFDAAKEGYVLSIGTWDEASAVVATPDGAALLAGTAGHNGLPPSGERTFNGGKDAFILKADRQGRKLWHQTYDLGYAEQVTGLVASRDGGYYVAGWFQLPRSHETNIFTLKIDAVGTLLWSQTVDLGAHDRAFGATLRSDGSLLVVGASDNQLMLTTFGENGTVLESHVIPDTTARAGHAALEVADGFLITGEARRTTQTKDSDILLAKVDRHGKLLWAKAFGDTQNDFGRGLLPHEGGYLLGVTVSDTYNGDEGYETAAALLKVDAAGEQQWLKEVGGDRLNALIRSRTGGFWLAGNDYDTGSPLGSTYGNVYLAHADAAGERTLDADYHRNRYEYGLGVAELSGGQVMVVGYTTTDERVEKRQIYLVIR